MGNTSRLNLLFPPLSDPEAPSGYGAVAWNLLWQLEALGMEPALFQTVSHSDPTAQKAIRRRGTFDPEAPCLNLSAPNDFGMTVGRGLRCGMTFFETTRRYPHQLHHLRQLDRLLVTSAWAMECLLEDGLAVGPPDRLAVVPLGVDLDLFQPGPPRVEDSATTFVNVGKWETRKGQEFLVKAFNRAFTPRDRVRLRLVCSNPYASRQDWIGECLHSPLGHLITPVAPLKTRKELAAFLRTTDCGVFPARAEGWNLPLLEMLAVGKHVIATDYSAHREFIDGQNCRLVHVEREEDAEPGVGLGQWAKLGDSEMDQLIEHMREVHRQKQEGRLGLNTAGMETARRFPWSRSAAEVAAHLS